MFPPSQPTFQAQPGLFPTQQPLFPTQQTPFGAPPAQPQTQQQLIQSFLTRRVVEKQCYMRLCGQPFVPAEPNPELVRRIMADSAMLQKRYERIQERVTALVGVTVKQVQAYNSLQHVQPNTAARLDAAINVLLEDVHARLAEKVKGLTERVAELQGVSHDEKRLSETGLGLCIDV